MTTPTRACARVRVASPAHSMPAGLVVSRDDAERDEFGTLVRYTVAGFAGGLLAARGLDAAGLQRSGVGQWLVRTLGGEGESVFEGYFAFRRWRRGRSGSLAAAYGWGKLIGMTVPWAVDAGCRVAGIDVQGVDGFFIPYLYAMSDQFGGSVGGWWHVRRRHGTRRATWRAYLTHPVMATSVAVLAVVPVGLLAARAAGFRPDTQMRTALEVIAANLCWLPPAVGWLLERRRRSR